jgi:CubicO group peptidase (beta-lactamase class C family)
MIRQDGELEGKRILSPRTVALMRTNQVGTLLSDTGLGFGLGFETTDKFGASGLACVGSYGWSGAYGTTYSIDPESRLTIVMMQQVVPLTGDLRQKLPTMVYQALLEEPSQRCLGTTP